MNPTDSLAPHLEPAAPARPAQSISLHRNAFGKLVLQSPDGMAPAEVVPVRAFPIDAAMENIALVSGDGHELCWIDRLADVAEPAQSLIRQELAVREFMPEITRILAVSTYATPSEWQVETDRGPASLTLKSEQDIRRVAGTTLLISDEHGIHYLIRSPGHLDRPSRKLLDRFL